MYANQPANIPTNLATKKPNQYNIYPTTITPNNRLTYLLKPTYLPINQITNQTANVSANFQTNQPTNLPTCRPYVPTY